SRFLTHMKRLNDTDEGLTRYFHPIRELGRTLGPVLWQLPAQMSKPHLPKLENFLQHLPEFTSHAFEFRHPNWYSEEVCDLLDHYGVAFCEHDWVPLKPPRVTGGYRYLRFHGASSRYNGLYGDALKGVAEDLAAWRPKGTAFVYFNNDLQGHAVLDAGRLKDLLGLPRIPKSRPPRLQCS
ncbi:MAG TPA: DUF72 domain-containing protein, partial [Myxococcaceae bacterium]|nr:DUF72 domain-containing protein [Myxococcaceae bacterium]